MAHKKKEWIKPQHGPTYFSSKRFTFDVLHRFRGSFLFLAFSRTGLHCPDFPAPRAAGRSQFYRGFFHTQRKALRILLHTCASETGSGSQAGAKWSKWQEEMPTPAENGWTWNSSTEPGGRKAGIKNCVLLQEIKFALVTMLSRRRAEKTEARAKR